MKALRWYSQTNEFMDFVVIVSDEDVIKAEKAIYAGLDLFWDDGALTFGEAIEDEFQLKEIMYAIAYMPWDYANDCPIDEDGWIAWLTELDAQISVKELT